MKTTTFNNKKIIEHATNVSSPDPNNIPCTIINTNGIDHDNPKLQCVQSIGNIIGSVNDSNPRTKSITSNNMIINNANTINPTINSKFSPAIINKQSLIITTDSTFVSYTVIPSPDGTIPSNTPTQPNCNLINTGTVNNPILICKESITANKNITILPPIVPAGCILQNTGTQTNPLLSCQQILPPDNQIPPSVSPITTKSGTQTTGVSSSLNISAVTSGTQPAGALLSIQKSKNPYSNIIQNLNKNSSWSCPAGYISEYPDQALTDCDGKGNCTDFYQNPAVLNEPCIGPANASYKYNNDPYGALDMNSNIQCEYGFPIFNGININGVFTGDVKCLYQNKVNKMY